MVMDQIAQIVATIIAFIAPVTPYVRIIVLYVIPRYIAIGEFFVNFGNLFLDFIPSGTNTISYIIMGVFIVLGILGGVFAKTKEQKKEEASQSKYSPPYSK